jgi:hypothetical protein
MDSKYCSGCYQKRPLSSFAKNGSTSRLLASCALCCTSQAKSNTKRKALQQLDPNVPTKKRATACTQPKPSIPPPALLESRPEATIPPNPPESRPETTIPPPNPLESCLELLIHLPNLVESRPETPILILTPLLRLEATIPLPNLFESCLETPIRVPTPPYAQPQALGFLFAKQWQWIQNFNKAIAAVEIETCI